MQKPRPPQCCTAFGVNTVYPKVPGQRGPRRTKPIFAHQSAILCKRHVSRDPVGSRCGRGALRTLTCATTSKDTGLFSCVFGRGQPFPRRMPQELQAALIGDWSRCAWFLARPAASRSRQSLHHGLQLPNQFRGTNAFPERAFRGAYSIRRTIMRRTRTFSTSVGDNRDAVCGPHLSLHSAPAVRGNRNGVFG